MNYSRLLVYTVAVFVSDTKLLVMPGIQIEYSYFRKG